MTLDDTLRALVADLVREELAKLQPQRAEYMSPAAAAEYAEVAPGTIRRWIRMGRLPAHHAGRAVRVKRADLEKFLKSDRRPANDLTPEQMAQRDFG